MSLSGAPLWKASHPTSLVWRIWDDGCVVFDKESGQMHLLNALAAEALTAIEEAPADAATLASHLASVLPTAPDPREFPRQVADLLSQFDRLGLAEPVEE